VIRTAFRLIDSPAIHVDRTKRKEVIMVIFFPVVLAILAFLFIVGDFGRRYRR
jgi:hypothetical protein